MKFTSISLVIFGIITSFSGGRAEQDANITVGYASGIKNEHRLGDCIPMNSNGQKLQSVQVKQTVQCTVYKNDVCMGNAHFPTMIMPVGSTTTAVNQLAPGDSIVYSFLCNAA
ncbi:uncharacterized protein BX664DRAFT_346979 [Halteromyces radiatus]|uniref:uncharacterized protein n=1 Tax=Halteromyces radiatus TaxID=101107 RepID=UPI00221E6DCB|nr:uncharacterized protein BX664DRAFT_346979 [Halteromyces radiatus]KAI8096962.1 hypothetical protein BX664DRAFT_346979 [Halteromyces radiatus]